MTSPIMAYRYEYEGSIPFTAVFPGCADPVVIYADETPKAGCVVQIESCVYRVVFVEGDVIEMGRIEDETRCAFSIEALELLANQART